MKNGSPPVDMPINDRILEIRRAKGLTQGEFAERINVSRSMIGSIEEKRRPVKDRTISLISLTFGANENWIRTGEGQMFETLKNERLDRITNTFKKLDENTQDYILKQLDILLEYRKKIIGGK
jgi:transcriptional regulator with XRE-family HTH domain